ncbi:ComEC/Rec2 family competence protein [Komagataeibacter europaeus]|uniref:ComEC/Rec2 family competence protein n=1 Tax=Komagataeibacter europaeus TaxID=33995 RepID=UPI000B3E80AD|nr:ComEC/Rec2 family competence protein [Komagataeibacter europaeus]
MQIMTGVVLPGQNIDRIRAGVLRMCVGVGAWLWGQHARFVLWLPVLLAAGMALYFTLSWEPSIIWAWGAATVVAGCVTARLVWGTGLPVRIGCGVLGACTAGALVAWVQAHHMPPFPDLPRRAVHLTGRVLDADAQVLRDGTPAWRVRLADVRFLDGINTGMPPLRRVLVLRLRPDDVCVPAPGDTLLARVMLSPPAFPALPGGYDAQRRAWFDGRAGNARALDDVTCRHGHAPSGLSARIASLRQTMAVRIRAALPGMRGDIAATVLAGADGAIAPGVRDAFADAGLAHLLAVAGLHLVIVMGLVMAGVRMGLALSERAALFWPCRQIAAVCALLAGGGYVIITGAHLPAQRSLFMAGLAVVALMVGRRVVSMRALAVAVTALLCLNAENVAELPLQMSAAAVMALIAGFDALRPYLSAWEHDVAWWRRIGGRLAHPLLASVLAGSACIPVGMAHFGTVQPWFVLANLLAVPLMSVWIMPWGLLSFVLMLPGWEKLALVPMGWGIGLVAWLARQVACLPVARIGVPAIGNGGLALFFAGLCWLCLWGGRGRLLGAVPVALALMSPWWGAQPVVMVSPDARMAGVVSGHVLLTGPGGHPDPFILREWQRVTGLEASVLPDDAGQGPLSCRGGACRVRERDGDILLLLSARGPGRGSCRDARMVVNLSGQGGCPGVMVIGRFDMWRNGAYALYPDRAGGIRALSDRQERGARPWVMRPGGAGVPDLPMAQAE